MAGSPLVTKLSHFMPLSVEDARMLDALCVNEERFEADTDIVVEGDVPCSAFVLTHGMACRYRLLPDGKRQILTFLIPGDVFDLHGFLLKAMDHSIGTLAPTRLAAIARATVFDLFEHHPRIVPHCGGARCRRRRSTASVSSHLAGEAVADASLICCANWYGAREQLG